MVPWVDDIQALRHPEDVKEVKEDLAKAFLCKYKGELAKYVGSKADLICDKNGFGTVKITQPLLVQNLKIHSM